MDLNFYSDLSDGTGQHVESEFTDSSSYNAYESVNKFAGGNDSYLTISGSGHHFLSSEQTFHTPSLGDEEFEIPPISLDSDSALTIEDVEAHFGELAEQAGSSRGPGVGNSLASNVVVGGNDPSFASTFMNPSSQGIEHLSLGVINQVGGSTLLSSTLGVDLGHSVGSHFNSSTSMTIDVPINDMNHSLLGHNQLTTIDHSDLSAQLGLSLGGGASVSKSPDQPLSATPSPAGSLQDEDMEDFRQVSLISVIKSLFNHESCNLSSFMFQKTMLVDSFSASPAIISHLPNLTGSAQLSSASPAVVRRVGAKPAMVAGTTADTGVAIGAKKGKKKKDPNEPQKPVSAYALFFRDTQAAIKGQNPNATFGEVSKIVASMWDSLGDEQKQVYKRKTEAAKKEYLKALATYRANQLSKLSPEVEDTAPSTPPSAPSPAPAAPVRPARLAPNPDQNTITNICTSNIILDLPQVTTRSRTGSLPVAIGQPPTPNPSPATTVTKIIISKQMLQGGAQLHQIPTSMVTVIPAGIRAVQPSAGAATSAGRQPPPLLQMQGTPPPPRLQQMVQTQAPPPLQAKPRGGAGSSVAGTAMPPPPLQIKIVPASLHSDLSTPIIVTTATSANSVISSSTISASGHPTPVEVQVEKPSEQFVTDENEAVMEELASEEMEMEVSVAPAVSSSAPNLCVRAGCTNPAVDSRDWDKEYCSNECVATHCRDIFMAWCSIKSQNSTTVK
ncbi:TOX high mobility group box family member 4-like isoform X1 [Myxocyprinus asiaticus]|uniref:TOX high mobility group box family member 4-like isoform X1 n=1 Tax=Myxocyprinus asiaticus TaxID=70543 RepID=UPI00222188D1|nr:TOX high mobility group box family member 4-like isoform X1 [Myxocyprinus asiaticus]